MLNSFSKIEAFALLSALLLALPAWAEPGPESEEPASEDTSAGDTPEKTVDGGTPAEGTPSVADSGTSAEEAAAKPTGVLTRPPEILESVEAVYPPELFEKGITGAPVLRITIDEKGAVTEVVLHQSCEQQPLDLSAIEALKKFSFRPAEIDNKPAPVQILYRYEFTIEEVVEEKVVEQSPDEGPRGSLAGKVYERGNRKALAGVTIRLVGMGRSTYTDKDGRFRFDNVPAGKLTIQLDDADHYLVEDEDRVEGAKETRLTYYLERSGIADDTVTVVGRRVRKEVVRRTLTVQEIRKIPGSNGDALKVIQNLPGVARIPFGGAGLIIRGSNPRDSAAAIGRHWVPLIFHFGGLRSVFPSELIESIDFYPGNFGVEYGRFAGGIVDVRLRRPKKDRIHGRVEADVFDAGIFLEGPLTEHSTFAIGARRSYIDVLLLAVIPEDSPINFGIAPRYYDYQAVWDYKHGAHRVHFDYLGSDDRLALLLPEPAEGDPAFRGNFDFMTGFDRGFLSWNWRISDDVTHEVSVSVGRNVARINLSPTLYFDNTAWLISARDDLKIKLAPWAQFRAGFDLEAFRGRLDISLPQPPKEGGDRGLSLSSRETISVERNFKLTNPSLWTELKLDLLDKRLVVIPGVRFDYDAYLDDYAFDPRLTVRYEVVKKKTVLKVGVGHFSQRPLPDESDPDFGNPDVGLEGGVHVSAGFEQQFGEQWLLDIVGFYKYLYDDVVLLPPPEDASPVADNPTFRDLQNVGEGRVYGMELLFKHNPKDGFFGWVSYTLMRSERKDPGSDTYRLFDYDQTHILTVLGMYKLNTRWEVGGRFRYVTGNPQTPIVGSVFSSDTNTFEPIQGETNSRRVPPFHQLDLRIDRNWIYDTWSLTAYFELRNAYNHANPEGFAYNYDYSKEKMVNGLPIIPSLGVRGVF